MHNHGSEESLIEKRVSSETVFEGYVFTAKVDQVETPSGAIRRREVIMHPGGVVVMPLLDNGEVILVRQYRYAINQLLYEFPAGKLEPGEDPADAVKRELEEETAYHADHWEELTRLYACPGFCNERLVLYKASGLKVIESPRREEDEHIHTVTVSLNRLGQMIRNGEIVDAKTICLAALVHPEIFKQ